MRRHSFGRAVEALRALPSAVVPQDQQSDSRHWRASITDIGRGNRIDVCLITTHHVARLRPATVKTFRRAVRFHPVPDLAHLRPPDVERPHIEALLHKMRDTPCQEISAVSKKLAFKPNGRYIRFQLTAKAGSVLMAA